MYDLLFVKIFLVVFFDLAKSRLGQLTKLIRRCIGEIICKNYFVFVSFSNYNCTTLPAVGVELTIEFKSKAKHYVEGRILDHENTGAMVVIQRMDSHLKKE